MIANPAAEEYRALWRHYGIEPALDFARLEVDGTPAGMPELPAEPTPPHHLVRVDGAKEPRIGFVISMPREDLRFRRDEEALWERILQALELPRADVALVMISWLEPNAPLTWARLRESMPAALSNLVFFGQKCVPADAGGNTAGSLPWLADGRWIATHELGRLLRDAQAKKETWTALKELRLRLN